MYQNYSISRISNLEKTHGRNSTFWKAKRDWLHFKSVDRQIMINEYFGVLPTGNSYSKNYAFKSAKVSDFTKTPQVAQLLPT
jgi:hypothetical protein